MAESRIAPNSDALNDKTVVRLSTLPVSWRKSPLHSSLPETLEVLLLQSFQVSQMLMGKKKTGDFARLFLG